MGLAMYSQFCHGRRMRLGLLACLLALPNTHFAQDKPSDTAKAEPGQGRRKETRRGQETQDQEIRRGDHQGCAHQGWPLQGTPRRGEPVLRDSGRGAGHRSALGGADFGNDCRQFVRGHARRGSGRALGTARRPGAPARCPLRDAGGHVGSHRARGEGLQPGADPPRVRCQGLRQGQGAGHRGHGLVQEGGAGVQRPARPGRRRHGQRPLLHRGVQGLPQEHQRARPGQLRPGQA